jgi:hypothetical protein
MSAGAAKMSITIRAHYDGKAIVPDEPVDLPVGQQLEAEVKVLPAEAEPGDAAEAREAWRRFVSRGLHGVNIPDEALRRENMYEERL